MRLSNCLFALPLAAALGACVHQPAATPAILEAQGAWRLEAATAADGTALLPAASGYRLQFIDDTVSVQGGCNRMAGSYAVADGSLRIGELASTRMACPEPQMQQDTTIARLLQQPLSMTLLERQPPQLQLRTSAGDLLSFSAMPLE